MFQPAFHSHRVRRCGASSFDLSVAELCPEVGDGLKRAAYHDGVK
jgi:hypothetical protein